MDSEHIVLFQVFMHKVATDHIGLTIWKFLNIDKRMLVTVSWDFLLFRNCTYSSVRNTCEVTQRNESQLHTAKFRGESAPEKPNLTNLTNS